MQRLTLSQWVKDLERQVATVRPAATLTLHEIGEAAVEIAKAKVGHYQHGWPPLAESTVADKERLGYAPPDNPLLRTGELRDSIGHHVEPMLLTIGSTDPVMKYQERGTDKIPPRPVIGPAMIEVESIAAKALGETLVDVLTGGGGVGRTVSRG